MSFDDVLREIRRCRYVIAATTLLGIGAAVTYWWFAPEEYESFARILVMPKDPAMASATRENINYDQEDVSDDLLATHIELIRSDVIVEAALESDEVAALTSIESHLGTEQSVTDYVIDHLWAHQGGADSGKDARTITVGFRHYHPEDSRRIVDAIVHSYQGFLADQFEDVTGEATVLISQAQDTLEQEIEELESKHLDLRRQGPIQVTRGDQVSNIHEETFAELESEISNIRVGLADANSRLRAIDDGIAGGEATDKSFHGLSIISENDAARLSVFTEFVRSRASQPAFLIQQPVRTEVLRAEFDRLVTLRAEERTLLEDFGSKHPDVVRVQHEIAVLDEALETRYGQLNTYQSDDELNPADLLTAYQQALTYDVAVMNDRLVELQKMAAQEEAKAKELVNFELSGNVLSSRIERKQQLYDAIVSRLHDVSLQSHFGSLLNVVLVPPKIGKRVWPKLSLCAIAGTAAGMFLGFCYTLVTFFASQRFRTIGEMARGLPVPVLASIPQMHGAKGPGRTVADSSINSPRSNWSRLLDLQFSGRSAAAVAIRVLRSSVLLRGRSRKSTLLLVTSPRSGDGTTVTAANLALSIAQAGRSTLLVDTRFDKPQIHSWFACDLKPGTGDVLEGRADLVDCLVAADTHLRLLPAGALQSSEADVYQSDRFTQLCELTRERFEFVVFDGPPILHGAEAQALSSLVDQVLLVSRTSKNTRSEIVTACCDVERHGGRLTGVVANTWDAHGAFSSDVNELAFQEFRGGGPDYQNGRSSTGEGQPEALSHLH